VFFPRAFTIICMFFNILVLSFAHVAVFKFHRLCQRGHILFINLHRVALSRPTAPIQCKFSAIRFIAFRFSRLSALYFHIL